MIAALAKGARVLNETVLKHFTDSEQGGFYLTADDAEKLIVRSKSMVDGKATVYMCRNFACEAPLTDPVRVVESLTQD